MSYDRVAYSDKRPFTSDNEFSDDPYENKEKNHVNGNGIYNDYTVEVQPQTMKPKFTFLCCTCRNTKRAKFIMFASVVVLLLSIVLIVVSALNHKSTDKAAAAKSTRKYGLFAYGPDDNGMLNYGLNDYVTYMKVINRLEGVVHQYSTLTQLEEPDKYVKCDNVTTHIMPPTKDQTCMQTLGQFGMYCQNQNVYGVMEGKPCILLVLKLEEGFMPELFDLTGTNNINIQKALGERATSWSVGISCGGKTDKDNEMLQIKLVNQSGVVGSMTNIGGPPVDYNPAVGFPLYFFEQKVRNEDIYINPAVMVQFNTIPSGKHVDIKCTAWAKNFDNGAPQNGTNYSVEFTVFVHA